MKLYISTASQLTGIPFMVCLSASDDQSGKIPQKKLIVRELQMNTSVLGVHFECIIDEHYLVDL